MKRLEVVGSSRYSLVRANTHGCRARRGARGRGGIRRYLPRLDINKLDITDLLRNWRW